MRNFVIGGLIGSVIALSVARAEPIKAVAAENVYGDIATQIGGANVAVTSILTSPSQDPHEFEANASTARAVADAKLVIFNGIGYDPWAVKLLSASKSRSREVIEVAKLVHKKAGDNPHLWYEPSVMSALAKVLADTLTKLDPANAADYARRLADFEASMGLVRAKIASLRKSYAGVPVTATEPVFDYMADASGLKMRNRRFQLAVMNGTEPAARDVAAFERDLRTRAVKVLIYNNQTGGALRERMRGAATAAGVPVVGVTETLPQGKNYQEWMLMQLDALDRALGNR
jgi:zinc/manganese transport system substrate-binding protein